MNESDYKFGELLWKSRFENEGTEFFAKNILQTKVPGTEESLTPQQKEALKAFSVIFSAKWKRAHDLPMTDEEIVLARKLGVSVQAGRSTGKSGCECMIGLNGLACYENIRVIFVGPDEDQVKKVSWAQMSQFVDKSLMKDDFIVQKKMVYLQADSYRETTNLSQRRYIAIETAGANIKTVAGQHPEVLIVVFTEASGLERELCKEIENSFGYKGGVSIMWIGYNPDNPVCYAAETQTINRELFECFVWSAKDSPLADPDFINEQIRIYGEDSPEILINVFGILPQSSSDSIVNWQWLQQSINRNIVTDKNALLVFPIDPARSANNCECAMGCMQNFWLRKIWGHHIDDTVELADKLCDEGLEFIKLGIEKGWWNANVQWRIPIEMDWGGGLYDMLKHHPSGFAGRRGEYLIPVRMNEKPKGKVPLVKFKSRRGELWYMVREKFEKGIYKIPDDQKLIKQLSGLSYTREGGLWTPFEKKTLKESPDRADLLAISCAVDPTSFAIQERSKSERTINYIDKSKNNNYSSLRWMQI